MKKLFLFACVGMMIACNGPKENDNCILYDGKIGEYEDGLQMGYAPVMMQCAGLARGQTYIDNKTTSCICKDGSTYTSYKSGHQVCGYYSSIDYPNIKSPTSCFK